MKHYIEYPILITCNLKCSYCYHTDIFTGKETRYPQGDESTIPFTVEDWIKFRDTHLKDSDDLLIHFHGGEPFYDKNVNRIVEFAEKTTKERFDILSNGIGFRKDYERFLVPFKNRIRRIGFTFHRLKLYGNVELTKRYEDNVLYAHSLGITVYVKELLIPEDNIRWQIKENKEYWLNKGIRLKVQDFKGEIPSDWGNRKKNIYPKYTAIDYLMVDQEYHHEKGAECYCVEGYKNLKIRSCWQAGDIIACWHDPSVIGNLIDNTYNPDYKIMKNNKDGRIDVTGVPKIYKGTLERDIIDSSKE